MSLQGKQQAHYSLHLVHKILKLFLFNDYLKYVLK